MPKAPTYDKFFSTYLAQIVDEHQEEQHLDCPFSDCLKEEHFKVNINTSLWHCVRCDRGGNAVKLLTHLHQQYLEETTEEQYLFLQRMRGIAWDIFSDAQFAYDIANDRWLVPYFTYNPEFKDFSPWLNNLGYFYPTAQENPFVIKKASGLPTYLYNPGLHQYDPVGEEAVILEGEWDTLAYYDCFRESTDFILGKPGAGFPAAALETIKECKSTTLILDNDMSGRKQTAGAIKVLLDNGRKRIKHIDWLLVPNALKDIRDHWTQAHTTMQEDISNAIVPYSDEPNSDEPSSAPKTLSAGYVEDATQFPLITSFGNYIERLQEINLYSKTQINAIGAIHGITNSIGIPGRPLWGFFKGPGSCIAGDVVVKINRAGASFDITMKELCRRFNEGLTSGRSWAARPDIVTKVQQRTKEGSIQLTTINAVMYSGLKQLYTLRTETGKEIRTSADHLFLTPEGWMRLKELHVGDYVYSNQGRKSGTPRKQVKINTRVGCRYHPYAQQKNVMRISDGYSIPLHRATVEAAMNNMTLATFLYAVRKDKPMADGLKYLDPEFEHVHHIDGNRRNNNLDNLLVIDPVEHARMHSTEEYFVNVLEQALPDRIVAIVEDNVEDVFDLSVDAPHNFLANGIVVHNSGKNEILESFGGTNQWFDNLSRLSSENLVSGWVDDNPDSASYLGRLFGKTLIVKDLTPNLTGDVAARTKLFGLLTDIYDGTIKIHFGNRREEEYHGINFNLIAGVTDILDAHSSASIGERFLRIDWLGTEFSPREYLTRAFNNFGLTDENKKKLTALTLGFVRHLRSLPIDLTLDPIYRESICDLAEFVAILRTKVESNRFEGLIYRPRPELPMRVGLQLLKLHTSCRAVTGSAETAFAITRKVALDTCYGFPLDIVQFILDNPRSTREEIAQGVDLHAMRAYRVLEDLVTTGVLRNEEITAVRSRGRPRKYYSVNPRLLPALRPEKFDPLITAIPEQYLTSTTRIRRIPLSGIPAEVQVEAPKSSRRRPINTQEITPGQFTPEQWKEMNNENQHSGGQQPPSSNSGLRPRRPRPTA